MATRFTHKSGFDFRTVVDRDEVGEMFNDLEDFARNHILSVMRDVMKDALNHAERVMDALIYDVDPYDRPSFYPKPRTGHLKRSISGFVRREANGIGLYLFNRADYARYNELGTLSSAVSIEEVRNRAEAAALKNKDLVLVHYTAGRGGLEPRPHIIPTLVFIEFNIPDEVAKWFRANVKGFIKS